MGLIKYILVRKKDNVFRFEIIKIDLDWFIMMKVLIVDITDVFVLHLCVFSGCEINQLSNLWLKVSQRSILGNTSHSSTS